MAINNDFIVKNGIVVKTTATIQSTNSSTNTFTGALIVSGGVGIGGSLYASEIYENGYRVLTTASGGGGGISNITVGNTPTVGGAAGQILFDTGSVISESPSLIFNATNPSLLLVGNTVNS